MGPVSQGSMNDLSAMVGLVDAIIDNKKLASIIQDLKSQMDEIVIKGAAISELEANLKDREAKLPALISDAEEKISSAKKGYEESAELKKALGASYKEVMLKLKEANEEKFQFDLQKQEKEKELSAREENVSSKEEKAKGLLEEALALKQEYEDKVKQLKQIVV